ncbi:MAG: hypothetical protein H0U76_09680 [Ktedonobacteraceae bacterium]|nr:hypothetical protein [Ktedonobacteraceae bacterium]
MIKIDYTREELIVLCELAIIPEESWRHIDTSSGQKKIGNCWALLKAGCQFSVLTKDNKRKKGTVFSVTNERTIWVEIEMKGVVPFKQGPYANSIPQIELFYIPTLERLEAANGEDWARSC